MSDSEVLEPPLPTIDAPVDEGRRLESLDLVRGVAILGILIVNALSFGLPTMSFSMPGLWEPAAGIHAIGFAFVYLFALGKFFSLFSILFGAGLWLQTNKTLMSGHAPASIYLKRLAVLLGIGVIHATLIWHGDILITYALVGLIVFLMRKLSDKVLVWVSVVLLVLPMLCCGGPLAVGAAVFGEVHRVNVRQQMKTMEDPPEEMRLLVEAEFPSNWDIAKPFLDRPFRERFQLYMEHYNTPLGASLEAHTFARGAWHEILATRVLSTAFFLLAAVVMFGYSVLAYMLLGLVLMRRGVFSDPSAHAGLLKRLVAWGLPVGMVLQSIGLWLAHSDDAGLAALGGVVQPFGAVGMTAAYLGLLLLACRSQMFLRTLAPLRACGRMALTNYLAHSVIFTLIFYSYGFGLFGRFGAATLLLFVVGMWALQLIISPLWLRTFRFGPIEWLWRSITYGRFQPMRRAKDAT